MNSTRVVFFDDIGDTATVDSPKEEGVSTLDSVKENNLDTATVDSPKEEGVSTLDSVKENNLDRSIVNGFVSDLPYLKSDFPVTDSSSFSSFNVSTDGISSESWQDISYPEESLTLVSLPTTSGKDSVKGDTMLSIGKVADIVGVKSHTIRYWQKNFPHIQCSISEGGHRYYTTFAVEQFIEIKRLMKDCGIRMEAIQRILDHNTPCNLSDIGIDQFLGTDKVSFVSDSPSSSLNICLNSGIDEPSRLKALDILYKINSILS